MLSSRIDVKSGKFRVEVKSIFQSLNEVYIALKRLLVVEFVHINRVECVLLVCE